MKRPPRRAPRMKASVVLSGGFAQFEEFVAGYTNIAIDREQFLMGGVAG